MKNILIGGAWPYANGSLHIGHIAALLPGDVLARYHRAKGDRVYYVSGSDCHGTPVAIRAKQEGKTPQEISEAYHQEFRQCFKKLGFSYDVYTKTSAKEHKAFVQEFHRRLYESSYIYEKESPQAFCQCCQTFQADRFVTGRCPCCQKEARGDQCDSCGTVLEPEQLLEPRCAVCGMEISFRPSCHLYIALSKMEGELREWTKRHPDWRRNAQALTSRYLEEGLQDRALTRDLEWGIAVPKAGYEDKKIYIWAENVLGYLSAGKIAAGTEEDFRKLWFEPSSDEPCTVKHYYVHGKDNIPFHTVILPALLMADGQGWHLPDEIISSEYMTLEGRKISTSQNYAVWIKDVADRYQSDSLRYYMLANGPEKRDADFSWREFIGSHNSELLGVYGNFINRSLSFIAKYLDNTVPEGTLEKPLEKAMDSLYEEAGRKIEKGHFKDALELIFAFARSGNKYFDAGQPWLTRKTDLKTCGQTLFNCVQMIANLAKLLYPFLPFSSGQVCSWLQLDAGWEKQLVPAGFCLPEIRLLFERIDKKVIEEEQQKLDDIHKR